MVYLTVIEKWLDMLSKILIINTGGTFNKCYHPTSGELKVSQNNTIIENAFRTVFRGNSLPRITGLIFKDSLEFMVSDRAALAEAISSAEEDRIVVVHGTDTLHLSAKMVEELQLNKKVVFTGSMVPFSIDPVEAVANLFAAYGFMQSIDENGVFVSLNGTTGPLCNVRKDREQGTFVYEFR